MIIFIRDLSCYAAMVVEVAFVLQLSLAKLQLQLHLSLAKLQLQLHLAVLALYCSLEASQILH